MADIVRVDLGEVAYGPAVEAMRGWVAQRQAGTAPDRLFLLSHPPVVTYGRHTPAADLPQDGSLDLVEVDRGGHATYHGPGQLVGYLVVNLRERGPGDVVRWLEHALIGAFADLGFPTVRRDTPPGGDSLVGVWTPEHHKLVSIGMRIRGGVTSHGFAVNVDSDLGVYDRFVACRLDGVTMTSLRRMADAAGVRTPTDAEVRDAVANHLGAA
ncbi:lipoyl(octanoyl) transferase LipB [Dactylosporangium sp. AC04546]|uniref:lipoyl(octanoyl) transferase LipB n=1 Tax=Dactylosporangium sp. AC04546 TaxID=2862460 RepID=UPI001EDF5347|nr:lipoyl(octanoyl) transferase LipB [Dactylosporangium sp. AC04546]WVK79946.1 lipoyl(octanoyl) transferase LipB [Dactylosporangium sp. AC04546]